MQAYKSYDHRARDQLAVQTRIDDKHFPRTKIYTRHIIMIVSLLLFLM